MARTLQSNDALEELALQGHGVTGAANATRVQRDLGRYRRPVPGQICRRRSQQRRLCAGAFLQQNIMGDAPFATTRENGRLVQLDQTGKPALAISDEVAAQDNTFWNKTYTKASFHA